MGYQDDSGVAVSALVNAGAQGLVVAGAGTALLCDAMGEAERAAVRSGVIVVRAPRSATGIVMKNIEFDDSMHGTVAGDTLSPVKAKVLLALALAQGKSVEEVQLAFDRY